MRPDRAGLDALADLVDAGKLRVDIAEAHKLSQEGHAGGKIVVTA